MNDVLRLIIYDATLSDSNVYTCRASNEAGEVKKHYNVTVKGKVAIFNVFIKIPSFKIVLPFYKFVLFALVRILVNTNTSVANTTLVVNEFEDVHLSCPLPNPNVKWFKVSNKKNKTEL